jgi:hypothetical protein
MSPARAGLGIPTFDYHSAHKPPVADAPAADRVDWNGSVALVHDIVTAPTDRPLPAEYDTCDAIVTDLPWANGFGEFNRRAGVKDGRTYRDFLAALARVITTRDTPIYLVTGQHAFKQLPDCLPEPAFSAPVRLNEYQSVVIAYRAPVPTRRWTIAQDVLLDVAASNRRIGDFCCGYGRTARIALGHGRTFVASDNNPYCIGYVAEHLPEWTRR